MQNRVTLPQWLDHLIFEELGAKYCRSNSDMTVIDWDKNDMLNYLGTFFPRRYAESYCIFSDFSKLYSNRFADKEEDIIRKDQNQVDPYFNNFRIQSIGFFHQNFHHPYIPLHSFYFKQKQFKFGYSTS